MKKETLQLLPEWYTDKSPKDLILSDDLDSLLSLKLLEQIFPNWRLKYFFDFDSGLYVTGENSGSPKNAVGVDIALDYKNIKTFDNHVTTDNGTVVNPNSINLNNAYHIGSSNYSQKYCGSTVLLIYSLYNLPLPKSNMGKAILLAIDSTYFSYFNPIRRGRQDWLKIHEYWLCDILELPELYEFESHYTMEDFDTLKYLNDAKIQLIDDMDNGKYNMYYPLNNKYEIEKALDISLDIPSAEYRLNMPLTAKSGKLNGRHKSDIDKEYKLASFAMTGKNYCNYSVVDIKQEEGEEK